MASQHFADRLVTRCRALRSPVCVGIDPRPNLVPPCIGSTTALDRRDLADAYVRFAELLFDAVHDIAPIVKFQLAFYETLGAAGIEAYERSVISAREHGLLVIADAKRGDIGSTAEAYASAFFGDANADIPHAADAVTLNPYLGWDSVEPFVRHVRDAGRGVFLLGRTSNPSAPDFQDLKLVDGKTVAHRVASTVADWGSSVIGGEGYSALGLVVGATYPNEIREFRRLCPSTPLLVPGFGAQGGTAASVAQSLDTHGLGAIISSSREIMLAASAGGDSRPDAVDAVRRVVQGMRDKILEAHTLDTARQ